MEVATYVLFILGCLGAVDILTYHCVAHGIRSHPDSRSELIVHSLRGPTYAMLFLLIPNFAIQGFYFWLLIGLFVCDVAISICDFTLEAASRRFFGGLPTGEYVLHVVIGMLFGALVTSVAFGAHGWASMPNRLVYSPAHVPGLLRLIMAVMAVLVLFSGLEDALAAVRLHRSAPEERGCPHRPDRWL